VASAASAVVIHVGMILNKSVVAQFAIIFLLAALMLFFSRTAFAFLIADSAARRNSAANLIRLGVLLLTAIAKGFFHFLDLRLALGAQRRGTLLLGVATGLEFGFLLIGRKLVAFEQGAFARADLFFFDATVQIFVLRFVVEPFMISSPFFLVSLVVFGGKGESGVGLFDAINEAFLHRLAHGFFAFLSSAVAFAAGSAAAASICGFCRRRAAVVSIASIEFRFQTFELGFHLVVLLFFAIADAFVEILNFLTTIFSSRGCGENENGENDQGQGLHD